MNRFIVNRNPQPVTADHEVHNVTAGCRYLPNPENRIDLGMHASCREAVSTAKVRWPGKRINGCYYCARPCHTS